jgi:ATP-binding cassette subfamily F protein 3
MIQLTGAAKPGPKTLFENFDWLVTPNERAGIVGASVFHLPQEGPSLSGRTVFAECMTVFADLLSLEQEQEALAHKMSEIDPASPEYAQVAECFHRAKREFRARTGILALRTKRAELRTA